MIIYNKINNNSDYFLLLINGQVPQESYQSIKSSFIDYTFDKNPEGFTRARI